jgi:hypothetical protein
MRGARSGCSALETQARPALRRGRRGAGPRLRTRYEHADEGLAPLEQVQVCAQWCV